MANEFYITAGLPAIDYNDIATVATNAFYITAGLPANDYTPPAGTEYRMIYHNHYQQMKVV